MISIKQLRVAHPHRGHISFTDAIKSVFHFTSCWGNVETFVFSLSFSPQSQKDPMLVEKIMNDLDSNKDNEVDFNEFVVLVAALTVACNDFFQEQKKKAK